MNSAQWIEKSDKYIMNTYGRYPIVPVRGEGCQLWDADGKRYLDFLAGVAVNNLGHCHPKVVKAIQEQAAIMIHCSNYYQIPQQIELAELLCSHSFADQAFFCNSGAEANEAAIKLARKYSRDISGRPERYAIITAADSFHGRTMATVSATGQEKVQRFFDPLLHGFSHVPFNDIEAMAAAVTAETCAVMLEPIQGEGGVNIPDHDYLAKVRDLCDQHGLLLILDEVQVGMGRTGKLFAHEHFGITPDIMTLAKALAGGAPIGTMLAKKDIAAAFVPGTHGSTFGGNPLVCAAAIATIETLLEDGFILDQCNRMSAYLMDRLRALKADFHDKVIDVRGMGLLIGMELMRDGLPYVNACLERGVLVGLAGEGNVLRFTPPLIIDERDIDHLSDVLEEVLEKSL